MRISSAAAIFNYFQPEEWTERALMNLEFLTFHVDVLGLASLLASVGECQLGAGDVLSIPVSCLMIEGFVVQRMIPKILRQVLNDTGVEIVHVNHFVLPIHSHHYDVVSVGLDIRFGDVFRRC